MAHVTGIWCFCFTSFSSQKRGRQEGRGGKKSKRGNVYYLLTTITTDQICFKFEEHPTVNEVQESSNSTVPCPSKTKHSFSALLALQNPNTMVMALGARRCNWPCVCSWEKRATFWQKQSVPHGLIQRRKVWQDLENHRFFLHRISAGKKQASKKN